MNDVRDLSAYGREFDPRRLLEQEFSKHRAPASDLRERGEVSARTSFAEFLQSGLDELDGMQQEAQESFEALLSGEEQDLHAVMIKMNEADLALRFGLELRNRLLEAYGELQRMPI